jgi:spore maturation protein CgeB
MKIGFYIQWPKGSLKTNGNVIGDELHAEGMCRALRKLGVESCEIYAPNFIPRCGELDVLVYLNDSVPQKCWAKKHVLYMQNAFGEGSHTVLIRLQKIGFDGYAFISKKLLELHKSSGRHGIWLPFGVDTGLFQPVPPGREYSYDVAYIGNDIKGEARTLQYIYPAARFDFGLFGNWKLPRRSQILFWRSRPYQRKFSRITQGKIPQEDVPLLYSHSKINLNCTAQDCLDWDVITLRTYEVLACKGFLISDRVPSAEQELEDGVAFTEGGRDLLEKIKYFLTKPKERERIAQNGYDYVQKNATSHARMTTLYEYLKVIL